MKIKHIALFVCAVFASTLVSAQDDVFLSLTRKAKDIKEMPTNVTVIGETEIAAKKAENAGEIIKNTVGLTSGQYGPSFGGQFDVMLRGSSPEEVLVLIDGRRINNPSMGLVNMGLIPAENIEKIEIIRGGASAIYGTNAFGGTINIITKKPKDDAPSAELGFNAGNFNTQGYRLNLNAKKGALSGFASAGKSLSDGWRDNSKFDGRNFSGRLGYEAGAAGNFDLSASIEASDYGTPGPGATLDKYDGTVEKESSSDGIYKDFKNYYRLEQSLALGENLIKNSVYSSLSDSNYSEALNFKDNDYKNFVFGAESQFIHEIGFTAGAEWWEESYKNGDNIMDTTLVDKSRVNAACYIQQELKAGNFAFIPSARYDSNSVFGSVFSPRTTITWQASDALKLSANSAKAWRAPTFNELYWVRESFVWSGVTYITEGTPDLVPEEGITSDLGAEYTFSACKAGLTAFLTDSRNLISWDSTFDAATNTSFYKTANINKAKQTGAEFTFDHKLASGLYHSVNYMYLWAQDTVKEEMLIYRPRNTANYKITCLTPFDTRFDVSAQYVSEQETGETYAFLPEYTLVNFGVSQKIRDTELWLKANNVTDKKYQTRNKYPLPGINFNAGVTVKFWN
ncbi:MAG: TonB-dependent receptor [Elusimicrobiota bacterium]